MAREGTVVRTCVRTPPKSRLVFEANQAIAEAIPCFAAREGFEPPEAFTSDAFKAPAFGRSAISPRDIPKNLT